MMSSTYQFFTVFDTSKGFFHVPLDQESKILTVMLTPFGIDVYNVSAMGLSNATDLFETCMCEVLQGLTSPMMFWYMVQLMMSLKIYLLFWTIVYKICTSTQTR